MDWLLLVVLQLIDANKGDIAGDEDWILAGYYAFEVCEGDWLLSAYCPTELTLPPWSFIVR